MAEKKPRIKTAATQFDYTIPRLMISEIAYELGFEHPQSFSKLFKQKTKQSPVEFRAGFKEVLVTG